MLREMSFPPLGLHQLVQYYEIAIRSREKFSRSVGRRKKKRKEGGRGTFRQKKLVVGVLFYVDKAFINVDDRVHNGEILFSFPLSFLLSLF